ncbi:MAG: rRNA maturation RNase YbeY [candidate division Zixibacteria bacterium]|nr:rRNA maturation RNase YbeY [candidate division Zixibacteria bacterium]MDH3937720.1 rRNA maturation RNase YbeY [candidate division Zixibacteria bacterium]MDH4032828.1 rRNA maturation RNase YbeY [candidate division Zixibacteria bacterium]
MKLSIFKETTARVPAARLRQLFEIVSRTEAPRQSGEVNLVFTTDAGMRRLNRQYRNLDKTTDVLSFNLDEPDHDGETFGEVYISVTRAHRQAEQYGHSRYQEYLRLTCHGLLHLFGYDHEKQAEQKRMQTREDKYLTAVREANKR